MATKIYDVVVVGSGPSGGTLSAHLARRGVDVVVVEGGPKINTRTAFNTHAMPFDFPNRHIPTMPPGAAGFSSDPSRRAGGGGIQLRARPRRGRQIHDLERGRLAVQPSRFQGPVDRRRGRGLA